MRSPASVAWAVQTAPTAVCAAHRFDEAALEREGSGRATFLAEACGDDEQLRQEVESLIAHIVPDTMAEGHAVEEATRLLGQSATEPTIERIGRYQIIRSLGAGGMGRVYLGHDEQLNRPVAVKLLSHYDASEAERMRRFRQEALAASALTVVLRVTSLGDAGHAAGRPARSSPPQRTPNRPP